LTDGARVVAADGGTRPRCRDKGRWLGERRKLLHGPIPGANTYAPRELHELCTQSQLDLGAVIVALEDFPLAIGQRKDPAADQPPVAQPAGWRRRRPR
jgi:hypothetical protein